MKKTLGLWIDHRKAVVVVVTDDGEEIKRINSNVEKQPRRSDASDSKTKYDSSQVPADDLKERVFMGHLDVYYDEVIAFIREAESILIFGPGEAKGELKNRMEKNNLGGRIVSIETVDKMTDRQIAGKVREYFLKQSSAKTSG